MGESEIHILKKEKAKEFLIKKGFTEDEIFFEHRVYRKHPLGNDRYYYDVDVVGIKGNYKVAIECGSCPQDKLKNLEEFFEEVVHIPYIIGEKNITTIRVSRDTHKELVLIKISCKAKDLNEVIGKAIILLKKELKK